MRHVCVNKTKKKQTRDARIDVLPTVTAIATAVSIDVKFIIFSQKENIYISGSVNNMLCVVS